MRIILEDIGKMHVGGAQPKAECKMLHTVVPTLGIVAYGEEVVVKKIIENRRMDRKSVVRFNIIPINMRNWIVGGL